VVLNGESSHHGNRNAAGAHTGGGAGRRENRKGVLVTGLTGGMSTKRQAKKAQQCSRQDAPDPFVFDLTRRSVAYSQQRETNNANANAATSTSTSTVPTEVDPSHAVPVPAVPTASAAHVYAGQHHLLYKQQKGHHNAHAATATASSNSNNKNNKSKKATAAERDAAASAAKGTQASPTATHTATPTAKAGTTESRTTVRDTKPAVHVPAAASTAIPKKSNKHHNTSKPKQGSGVGTTSTSTLGQSTDTLFPTRVVVRRHSPRHYEEGMSGTHIYCIRYPAQIPLDSKGRELPAAQEQCPNSNSSSSNNSNTAATATAAVSHNNTVTKTTVKQTVVVSSSSSNQDRSTASTSALPLPTDSTRATTTTPTTTSAPTVNVDSNVVKGGSDNTSNSDSGSNVKPAQQTGMTSAAAAAAAAAAAQGETTSGELNVDQLFRPSAMAQKPTQSGTYIGILIYWRVSVLRSVCMDRLHAFVLEGVTALTHTHGAIIHLLSCFCATLYKQLSIG
jgi:hypothetical protein